LVVVYHSDNPVMFWLHPSDFKTVLKTNDV